MRADHHPGPRLPCSTPAPWARSSTFVSPSHPSHLPSPLSSRQADTSLHRSRLSCAPQAGAAVRACARSRRRPRCKIRTGTRTPGHAMRSPAFIRTAKRVDLHARAPVAARAADAEAGAFFARVRWHAATANGQLCAPSWCPRYVLPERTEPTRRHAPPRICGNPSSPLCVGRRGTV